MIMIKYFVAVCLILISHTALANYYVGVSKANITPKNKFKSEVCMGGYGAPFQKCGLTEVNDKLTVRTIAISDHDTTMVIASLDAPGISKSLLAKIKAKVERKTRLKSNEIFISATHTHSGPDLLGIWGGSSDEYQNYIVKKVTKSIKRAYRNQEHATIYVTQTTANIENRRGWDVVDNSVNILDFFDTEENERIATLVNMSAHPTIIPAENTAYSADYVHYLRESVEDELGGITLFINGVVGDAQASTNGERGFVPAEEFGTTVGESISESVKNATLVSGDFNTSTIELTHPVSNPLILGAAQQGLIDLELNELNEVTTSISIFNFGNKVQGITIPGEALTRLAQPIKEAMTGQNKFFFGLTNDTLGYFLPVDEFLQIEGRTTEEGASLDPLIGEKIKATAISLLNQ